jgi:Co/Zn/Cd efflux system component
MRRRVVWAAAVLLADAAVSVLAVVGLLAGRELGLVWMDPVMGIVGALVVANWSWTCAGSRSGVARYAPRSVARRRYSRADRSHRGKSCCRPSSLARGTGTQCGHRFLGVRSPQAPASYKERLIGLHGLSHVTAEVEACPGEHG